MIFYLTFSFTKEEKHIWAGNQKLHCFTLVQVLSVRKGGGFPGRQFNLDEEDEDEDGDDMTVLERKVHGANMSEAALRVCLKELKR